LLLGFLHFKFYDPSMFMSSETREFRALLLGCLCLDSIAKGTFTYPPSGLGDFMAGTSPH